MTPTKIFSDEDHKYLAFGLLRKFHHLILNLIATRDKKVSFIYKADIPLCHPIQITSCNGRNQHIDRISKVLACEICRKTWHFNCIHDGGKEDFNSIKEN